MTTDAAEKIQGRDKRRADFQSKIRRSVFTELIERKALTPRQALAAKFLEEDREAAMGVSPGVLRFSGRVSTGSGTFCGIHSRESDASIRLRQLIDALPGSMRRLYGKIEQANWSRAGALAALPVGTGLAADRESALVKRGMMRTFLDIVADHYRLPEEA